jgi:8-oxo-dGTP pyrophosphatase MutT (NUDIX family)
MNKLKWSIYKITHPFVRFYWKIFKPKTYGSRAIILQEKDILLVKNINHDYWSLPGGKIDKEERPEECLIRELKEELSLSISNIDYKLGEYTSNKEGKQDTIYIFVIKLLSPTFQKQWELEDSRWFPLSNLPTNISPAANRRIIEFQKEKMDLISTW